MTIRIEFRPSTVHAETISRIDAECFPEEPFDARAIAETMEQQDLWIAWDDDQLAGYVHVRRKPDISWLARLATAARHRRRGVATALMSAALDHCVQIGLPETVLYVRSENPDAIRIYERFGFRRVEATWQFVLLDPQSRLDDENAGAIVAVPISDVPEPFLPAFPREWGNIAEMHMPPGMHVLIFRRGKENIGYCRLTPGFPGCFPFVVDRPSENLLPALCAMKRYLQPDKPLLKLTLWDSDMAAACHAAGMELNYELMKMVRQGRE